MSTGVYLIENSANGKVYIGRTVNAEKRFAHHKWALDNGCHKNAHLQAAYDKHGGSSFDFRVLFVCRTEDLAFFEKRAIKVYRSGDPEFGYNLMGATDEHYVHRPETNEKTSAFNRERWKDPEYRAKKSEAQKAVIAKQWEDPAFREARSRAASEQWKDEDRRRQFAEKQSANQNVLWADQAHREKMAKSHAKAWDSEERRAATSARSKAAWANPETRAKLSETMKRIHAERRLKKSGDIPTEG